MCAAQPCERRFLRFHVLAVGHALDEDLAVPGEVDRRSDSSCPLGEVGVVVHRDLAVQCDDPALLRADERVGPHQQGVLADQGLPEPDQGIHDLRGQARRFGDPGRLLDLRAALRRGDGEKAARRAVEEGGPTAPGTAMERALPAVAGRAQNVRYLRRRAAMFR